MKKLIYFIVTLFMVAFTSCSDQEEIEFKYQTTITLSVEKLMTDFQERTSGDFDIVDGLCIRLQSYIYDDNGKLVQSKISSVSDYAEKYTYSCALNEGKYIIITTADFIAGSTSNPTTEYWQVKNETNLSELHLIHTDKLASWAWETLGLSSTEIVVSEKSQDVTIPITPITGLVQIVFDYLDVVNGNGDGISIYAPFASKIRIASNTQPDIISDFNNFTWSFNSSASQKESYNIAFESPMETIDKGYTRSIAYRALLPQKSKLFYWELSMLQSDGSTKDFKSEFTSPIDIESRKQYELYLYLDDLNLYVRDDVNKSQSKALIKSEKNNTSYCNQSVKVIDYCNGQHLSLETLKK